MDKDKLIASKKPRVLVIEDQAWVIKSLVRELGDRVKFQFINNIPEAQRTIEEMSTPVTEPELFPDLVVLNGRANGPLSDSIEFAQWLKALHPGLTIIGTSNDSLYRDKLRKAGCNLAINHSFLSPVIEYVFGWCDKPALEDFWMD